MEWNFLGLNSKNSEEDAGYGSMDSARVRGSRMQWTFSNRVSVVPQLMSFKVPQEDRPRKTIVDPVASSACRTISTADAFDSNNIKKQFLGVMQKNLIVAKREGNRHGMTVYPMQHLGGYSACPEATIFPVYKQSNQMSRPVLQSSNHVSSNHHMLNSTINPKPPGGVPVITPAPVLPSRGLRNLSGSIVGITDLRNSSKPSGTGTRAQLTIFYAGSVCVFEDITPEKAQEIMLLAGKVSISSQNMAVVSSSQVQAPISVPSSLPSPLHERRSSTNNELSITSPAASSVTIGNLLESPKPVCSSARKMVPSGLPLARKASLLRFFEKRKERVLSVSPYSVNRKPGSDDVSFSLNSAGCFPLQAHDIE